MNDHTVHVRSEDQRVGVAAQGSSRLRAYIGCVHTRSSPHHIHLICVQKNLENDALFVESYSWQTSTLSRAGFPSLYEGNLFTEGVPQQSIVFACCKSAVSTRHNCNHDNCGVPWSVCTLMSNLAKNTWRRYNRPTLTYRLQMISEKKNRWSPLGLTF
jgi:hypothetical protein